MTLLEAYFAYRSQEPGEKTDAVELAAAVLLTAVRDRSRTGRIQSFGSSVVDDAVQGTMLALWTARKHPLKSDDNVRSFLFVVLYRKCVSIVRAQGCRPAPEEDWEKLPSPTQGVDSDVDLAGMLRQLRPYAETLGGVSRNAALELLDIHLGTVTFGEILAREQQASPTTKASTIRNRKYQQYGRAVAGLCRAVAADRSVDLIQRSLLHAVAGALGLSGC